MEITKLIEDAHENTINKGFWDAEEEIVDKMEIFGFSEKEIQAVKMAFENQRIMLIVTELGEYIEARRNNDGSSANEELADVIIRWADFVGGKGKGKIIKAIRGKMEKNKIRPRLHGKEF